MSAVYVRNVLSSSLKRQVKEKIIRMETARSGTNKSFYFNANDTRDK